MYGVYALDSSVDKMGVNAVYASVAFMTRWALMVFTHGRKDHMGGNDVNALVCRHDLMGISGVSPLV